MQKVMTNIGCLIPECTLGMKNPILNTENKQKGERATYTKASKVKEQTDP